MFSGNRLDELRRKRGFSTTELGAAAGVTETTIRNWAKGRSVPNVNDASRLAVALRCRIDDLLVGRRAS